MPLDLPADARFAVAVTVDFDAHSTWIGGRGLTSPSVLSRGDFGADIGTPRLVQLFDELDIKTTWFTPGHDLLTFTRQVESVMGRGHEIAAHGCYHEAITTIGPEREDELMAKQLVQHEKVVGKRPRGYRSPAWDFSDNTASILEKYELEWDSSLMGREFEPYRPRPVTTNYETASTFGEPSSFLEIPVSWYLDDWPAVEFVPGVSKQLGSHNLMIQRWQEIFDYGYERAPGGIYVLTVHPQTIGRAHHIAAFEKFLLGLRGLDGLWWPTLSEIYDRWID